MAYANKIIRNTITGQDIRFLQTSKDTGGQLLEMVTTYNSFSKEPIPHYHPFQEEDFTVIEGELSIRINNRETVLKEGDTIHVSKNVVHSMWNNTGKKTVVHWEVRPALSTEYLLETASGLAADGKTNEKGMPNLFQVALMMNKFADVFRLSKPPFIIQKTVFLLLAPFAFITGYKPTYKKYID